MPGCPLGVIGTAQNPIPARFHNIYDMETGAWSIRDRGSLISYLKVYFPEIVEWLENHERTTTVGTYG
jgi:hypothetical protein